MIDAVILGGEALALGLALLAIGGDDVARAAQLRQRGLDRRARRLLGLQEDESVLVADDHVAASHSAFIVRLPRHARP